MNFLSQYVPMDIDVNVPIAKHDVLMHDVSMISVTKHDVTMHPVPKHVTFMQDSFCHSYNAPTQVAHYIYSNSMIIDEHPNKVIIR
jgi:hypothetical protein